MALNVSPFGVNVLDLVGVALISADGTANGVCGTVAIEARCRTFSEEPRSAPSSASRRRRDGMYRRWREGSPGKTRNETTRRFEMNNDQWFWVAVLFACGFIAYGFTVLAFY